MKTPILLDIPETLETERLLLCCPGPGDGTKMQEAILETWETLRIWMPWAKGSPPTEEETEALHRKWKARFLAREEFTFQILSKATGAPVGMIGLHPRNWEVPSFEIGYWCRSACEGRGYISEAVRAVTRLAFEALKAQRVEIRCDLANERSRRVAQRCGYTLEATLRNEERANDSSLRHTQVFSLIPEEYGALT